MRVLFYECLYTAQHTYIQHIQNIQHSRASSIVPSSSAPRLFLPLLYKTAKNNHTKPTEQIMIIQFGRNEGGGGKQSYKSILCLFPASDLINPGETKLRFRTLAERLIWFLGLLRIYGMP